MAAQAFWEVVREQQAAGNYTLDSIDFYQVGDDIQWTVFNRHQFGSTSRVATQEIQGGKEQSRETWSWLTPHVMAYTEGDANGRWREIEARRYSVAGHTYWFRVWTTDTEHGPVSYGTAVIPGKSP